MELHQKRTLLHINTFTLTQRQHRNHLSKQNNPIDTIILKFTLAFQQVLPK